MVIRFFNKYKDIKYIINSCFFIKNIEQTRNYSLCFSRKGAKTLSFE